MAVANLTAFFGADTAQLNSRMNQAARNLSSGSAKMNHSLARVDRGFQRVGRSAASFAKRTLSIRGAIGLVAGSAGLGLLVKRSLDAADSIAKMADATGLSTKAVQEYRFALNLAGVSTEQTDKALKKFVKNMGELGKSSSETQSTLKDLDPTLLANFKSLKNVDDQLKLGFRALAGYASSQKDAAIGAALFGKAGIDVAVAIKGGIKPFEAAQQRASDLGTVLGGSLLEGAVASKDAITEFTTRIDANITRITLFLAPAIENLTGFFADLTTEIANASSALKSILDPSAAEQLASINAQIAALEAGTQKAVVSRITARPGIGPSKAPIGTIAPTARARPPGAEARNLPELEILLKRKAALEEIVEAERAARKAIEETAAATKEQTTKTETQTEAIKAQTGKVADFIGGLRNQNKLMLLDADARAKVVAVAKAQALAMAQGNLLTLDQVAAIRMAIDERQKLTEQIDANAKAAADMQAAQENAARVAQAQADAMARPCEEASPATQGRYSEQIRSIFKEAS